MERKTSDKPIEKNNKDVEIEFSNVDFDSQGQD